jgi:maltose O-acetyltransferase
MVGQPSMVASRADALTNAKNGDGRAGDAPVASDAGGAEGSRYSALYWTLRRQAFFLKQRGFSVLSPMLLDNRLSGRARVALLRACGATIGRRCDIRGGLRIQEGFGFTLGDDVFVNSGCLFDCSAPIVLGNGVELGYDVTIITGDHALGDRQHRCGIKRPRPVVIEDGAWIGAKTTIGPGVTIGAGSVVSAGSVVAMSVPANKVVGGNPARAIRSLE